jgi:DNA-binding transcriptional regulator YhcF (GntR family)
MRSTSDSLVVAELRRRLFMSELRPGTAVNIADVADDLGVSAAPVRDALMKLSERGLICRVDGRGFFVATTPDYEASELLEILHQILVFSIEKGRLTPGLDRWRRGDPSKDSGHDKLNIMLEAICSPTVAAIATSIADRLIYEDGLRNKTIARARNHDLSESWQDRSPAQTRRRRCRSSIRRLGSAILSF